MKILINLGFLHVSFWAYILHFLFSGFADIDVHTDSQLGI